MILSLRPVEKDEQVHRTMDPPAYYKKPLPDFVTTIVMDVEKDEFETDADGLEAGSWTKTASLSKRAKN
ncbi:MAG: hypothetical protein R2874_09265 [Desulfobacterales bacterium]